MSRFYAYLRNASSLVSEYDGSTPLGIFLKKYFAGQKKYGSNDRKVISSLCYQYYRIRHLFSNLEIEDRLLLSEFICRNIPSKLLETLKPDWVPFMSLSIGGKLEKLGFQWSPQLHTPWHTLLQKEISPDDYASSMFHQPNLHVRVRPAKKEKVLGILAANHLPGEWLNENTLAFPNATKLDDVFSINKDVVVQDAGSQRCGDIIKKVLPHIRGKVWDACAASGGKSIQLIDLFGRIDDLLVSDIRETILHNLSERFRQAGIHTYQSFVADLTKPLQGKHANLKVDVALVDVPCTGSGTWSRTPEHHYFFNPENLATFSTRQLQICHTVIPHIKKGGHLIYITCSVFDKENKMVVEKVLQQQQLSLIHAEVIDGTQHLHDSMYVAIMQKN